MLKGVGLMGMRMWMGFVLGARKIVGGVGFRGVRSVWAGLWPSWAVVSVIVEVSTIKMGIFVSLVLLTV